MKRKSLVLVLGICLALGFFASVVMVAAEDDPKVGNSVGNVKFAKPLSDDDAKYLGLAKAAEFTLKDIKGPYVFVEQFSTTCPHCMHQAPVLNNLFNMVQQDAGLKDKVMFLAAGQANDEAAVKMWKVFHKVPFPVIADEKSALGDALKFHPYPVSMLLDKTGKILIVHIGAFDSADEVFKEIKKTVK